MTLDDLPANCQTQSNPARLRRHECLEYISLLPWIDPRPVVQHFDNNRIAIKNARSNFQHSVSTRHLRHCFDCVVDQIVDELM